MKVVANYMLEEAKTVKINQSFHSQLVKNNQLERQEYHNNIQIHTVWSMVWKVELRKYGVQNIKCGKRPEKTGMNKILYIITI